MHAPDRSQPPDSILDGEGITATPATGADSYLMMLGLAILFAVIGITYFERGHTERRIALTATADRNAVLAMALAQYTVRALKTAEAVTHYVQREYLKGNRSEALEEILDDRLRNNDVFTGLGVFDAAGNVYAQAGGPWPLPPKLLAGLAVKPGDMGVVLGPSFMGTGRTSSTAPVVRRVGPPGVPGAFVVALVDNDRFLSVFQDARLGDDTVILLAGADGAVRAAWDGLLGERRGDFGSVRDLAALQAVERGGATRGIDGVARVVGMRQLAEYPLVALVGTTESGALAAHTWWPQPSCAGQPCCSPCW